MLNSFEIILLIALAISLAFSLVAISQRKALATQAPDDARIRNIIEERGDLICQITGDHVLTGLIAPIAAISENPRKNWSGAVLPISYPWMTGNPCSINGGILVPRLPCKNSSCASGATMAASVGSNDSTAPHSTRVAICLKYLR